MMMMVAVVVVVVVVGADGYSFCPWRTGFSVTAGGECAYACGRGCLWDGYLSVCLSAKECERERERERETETQEIERDLDGVWRVCYLSNAYYLPGHLPASLLACLLAWYIYIM